MFTLHTYMLWVFVFFLSYVRSFGFFFLLRKVADGHLLPSPFILASFKKQLATGFISNLINVSVDQIYVSGALPFLYLSEQVSNVSPISAYQANATVAVATTAPAPTTYQAFAKWLQTLALHAQIHDINDIKKSNKKMLLLAMFFIRSGSLFAFIFRLSYLKRQTNFFKT